MTTRAERIINKILDAQERWRREVPEIADYYEEGRGNIAQIEVLGIDGTVKRFKCVGDRILETQEQAKHIIRTSYDSFVDMILGEADFLELWQTGKLVFDGEDFFYHASRWGQAFRRIRRRLRL